MKTDVTRLCIIFYAEDLKESQVLSGFHKNNRRDKPVSHSVFFLVKTNERGYTAIIWSLIFTIDPNEFPHLISTYTAVN